MHLGGASSSILIFALFHACVVITCHAIDNGKRAKPKEQALPTKPKEQAHKCAYIGLLKLEMHLG